MNTLNKLLKRSVIKEELVILTGDYKLAITLNQMLYWTQRVEDFDYFVLEERQRAHDFGENEPTINLKHGWIYKKADELAEETMLGLNKSNMLRHLTQLVEADWLERRKNPKNKMDKTFQYRVNIVNIQRDLQNKGYALEGYPLLITESKLQNTTSKIGDEKLEKSLSESKLQNATSELCYKTSKLRNTTSELRNTTAIPEITTEITLETKDDEDEVKDAHTNKYQNYENSQLDTYKPRGKICNPAVLQNRAWEGQETLSQPIPQALRPCTPTPTDPDQPAPDGQAGSLASAAPTVATLTPTDDIYQQVDRRMTMHLGRMYIAKQGDYRAIVDLRASGVPGYFILDGIDYTFANFRDKHPRSFSYCAEIIKQRWALELEKHAPPSPVATQSPTPRLSRRKQPSASALVSQGSQGCTANGAHDERYGAFYELFPDV